MVYSKILLILMFFFFRYEVAILLFTYILLTIYVEIEPLQYTLLYFST